MHHPLKDGNIDVRLNVDYFKVKDRLPKHKLLIFTGPIDAFYADQGWQKLEYRSIFFEVRPKLYVYLWVRLELIFGVGSFFVQIKKEKSKQTIFFLIKIGLILTQVTFNFSIVHTCSNQQFYFRSNEKQT